MKKETLQAIGRLRRAQPKNPDTAHVLDEFEHLWAEYKKLASAEKLEIVTRNDCPECERRRRQTRDRVAAHRKRRSEMNSQ